MKTLGDIIKERRKYLRLTQAELGKRCGVRGPTVSEWENDLYKPKNLLKIASALELSLAELASQLPKSDSSTLFDDDAFISLVEATFPNLPAEKQKELMQTLMNMIMAQH